MENPSVTYNVARTVILSDTHALRFEKFCNDMVSAIEGHAVLSTSLTYDRGRDGKTVGPAPRIIVCTSLNDSPEKKALDDVAKIDATVSAPEKIWFCSSQDMSEYREDQLAIDIAAQLPFDVSVQVLDAKNLAELAIAQAPLTQILLRHYPSEIGDQIRMLKEAGNTNDARARAALNLALCTMGHKDSAAIRRDTYRATIRLVLADGKARNIRDCCRDLANYLKLAHGVLPAVLRAPLDGLVEDNEVIENGDLYVISPKGREIVESLKHAAEERRRYIRNAFVRGFAELMSRDEAKLGQWKQYIDQFKGKSADDTSRVAGYLRNDWRAGSLPRVTAPDSADEAAVFRFCEEAARSIEGDARDAKISGDKAQRDAELYISLRRYAETLEQGESGGNCFLVTSARRLREVERHCGEGEDGSRILSIPSTVAILSLVPGVTMGPNAMRAFMFDGSLPRGVSELEMTLRRVLHESSDVSLPFARRRALVKEVSRRIVRYARDTTITKEEGEKVRANLENAFKTGEKTEPAAAILSAALSSVGAEWRTERELEAAKKRIAELEAQLRRRH